MAATLEAPVAVRANPLHSFPDNEALVFRSRMSREQFHQFVVANPERRIERDKFGTITIHPPMTFDSGYYEGEAFAILRNWSKTNKLGRTFSPSTSFDLPDGSQHKADGAWVSMRKINQMTEEQRRSIASVVPDFVLEVRSETDRLSKLKRKKAEVWIANGVKLAWLIDPIKHQAWVFRANGSQDSFDGFEHKLSGEEVLPGFEFDLGTCEK